MSNPNDGVPSWALPPGQQQQHPYGGPPPQRQLQGPPPPHQQQQQAYPPPQYHQQASTATTVSMASSSSGVAVLPATANAPPPPSTVTPPPSNGGENKQVVIHPKSRLARMEDKVLVTRTADEETEDGRIRNREAMAKIRDAWVYKQVRARIQEFTNYQQVILTTSEAIVSYAVLCSFLLA